MAYKEIYITLDEYQAKYLGMGLLYEGFVIGYGYIYVSGFVIQPPHWNGYNPLPGRFYGEDAHCKMGNQLVEDRSEEAVILSLKPLRDELENKIITKNPKDGTLVINLGMNRFVSFPEDKGWCTVEFVKSKVIPNEIALEVSYKAKDDIGNEISGNIQILLKDIAFNYDLNIVSSEHSTMSEQSNLSSEYGPRWLSFIPIIGSARDAYEDFENGRYWWGAFNTVMAVSDIFFVKSLFVAGGKLAAKTAFKTGSHTWGATRSWMGRTGQAAKGQPVHHWFLHQNQGIGKHVPEWIKNQPWNLMPMDNKLIHQSIHGIGANPYNSIQKFYYGTPQWFKASGMYGINIIENGTRE